MKSKTEQYTTSEIIEVFSNLYILSERALYASPKERIDVLANISAVVLNVGDQIERLGIKK
jgi:hypothetical protein